MKIYIVEEYSLDYNYVLTQWDEDDDERWDSIEEEIDHIGPVIAFTNKHDAEEWVKSQKVSWDGQYIIKECKLD